MTKTEWQTAFLLAGIYASRMLGLFMIIPTFSLLATGLQHATPFKIGLALGIYSLAQATFQIPAGVLSDIIGRKKVLFIGLSLFFLGSVLAAMTDDINLLILARFLQGTGAVSAVCLAYVADSIRGSEHGKAMAVIGVSIGSAFILSFVLGSVISASWGLSGLFVVIAGLALAALLFAYLLPQPAQHLTVFELAEFVKVVKDKQLIGINIQIALLHMILSASFFLIPILLKTHLSDVDMVWLYVIPILLAFFFTLPIIRRGGSSVKRQLPLFWLALIIALFCFANLPAFEMQWIFMAILGLFFFAFTLIEAMLPKRLFELATNTSRGASSGVFSVYQFVGNFLGGLLGAKLYTIFAENGIMTNSFYILAALTLAVSAVIFIRTITLYKG